ncbi:MAG: UDP-N-acetylglucosamine 2-epimerase [Verrucomicrobiales bacterium]|nr:UDP-N-acetylglucosamine 2-epimerase [Verrucomicrobiales bacterium]
MYISGTRADFGLFRSTLELVSADPEVQVTLGLTGTHLDPAYGNSTEEVDASGLAVVGRIQVSSDGSEESVHESLSIQVREFGTLFRKEKPDAVILLGDRSEMLMAGVAALHGNFPILHIHGGELSGTIDESMRHAISKLSHYHFVSTQRSGQRLIRMGEQPDHVFVIGAPGLDDIMSIETGSREVWSEIGFSPEQKLGLVIFHPVVQDSEDMARQFEQVIEAAFALLNGFVLFRPNSDIGRIGINTLVDKVSNDPRVRVVSHLDRDKYLRILAVSDLLIGNSSSGIIEAASFSVPVVNIGDRQNQRDRSKNTFQADSDLQSILSAGESALKWKLALDGPCCNVYGDGKAGGRFLEILKTLSFDKQLLKKVFYE